VSGHERCEVLKAKMLDGHFYYVCPTCGKTWEQVTKGMFQLVGESFTEEELNDVA